MFYEEYLKLQQLFVWKIIRITTQFIAKNPSILIEVIFDPTHGRV